MDASKITELLQKQNTRFINRSQTTDSSTLIWKNQIQSSKYIKGVTTCNGEVNPNVPTNPGCSIEGGVCSFGGAGRTTSIQTGSPKQFLNVLSGARGSGSQIYSSDSIVLQKAGKESCGVPGTSPAPENSYVILPECFCKDTNGPSASDNPDDLTINNQSNPYLPPFDTYYRFKNQIAQCTQPIPDQNQKHFVKQCHSRFPNANNGVSVLCTECQNSPQTCNNCILEELQIQNIQPTPPPSPTPENQSWATYVLGTNDSNILSIAYDSSGYIYLTGTYTSSAQINLQDVSGDGQTQSNITLPATYMLPSSASSHMFLMKYDSNGIAQWAIPLITVNTSGNQTQGTSIVVDSSNNIYVTGRYNSSSTVTLQDVSGTGQTSSSITLASTTNDAVFILKYNPNGIAQWATYLDGTGVDNGWSIALDSFDNLYVTGQYNSSSPVTLQNVSGAGQTASSITLDSTITPAVFILKYDSNGIAQWATYLNGAGVDVGRSIVLDSTNNLYVTGQYNSNSSVTLQNVSGTGQTASSITLPVTSGNAVFILKYDSDGIAQWATYLDGTGADIGYSIALDSTNNLYVTGQYNSISSVTLQDVSGTGQTASSITLPDTSGNAVFILKYDSDGIAQWATYLDGTGTDVGWAIALDSTNNLYVTGQYNSSSPITGQTTSIITLPDTSGNAVFILKYDSDGIAQWATYLDGTGADIGRSIVLDANDNIYVSGEYISTTNVPIMLPNGNTQIQSDITLPSTISRKGFIIKYDL
jgi:hypothetical protein